MYTFISVFILLVCLFLVLIVLVQNSKGGGLAANFSSSNQVMGVRKTADFLEKATWTLAGVLMFLSVISAAFIQKTNQESRPTVDLTESPIAPINVDELPNLGGDLPSAENPE